jgi:16S rRNA (cytidine1402-2'-O)-methyltransferase
MTAALRIVATPIGNVGDMSPRAVDALATAEVVLAEDTRKSRPLLDRLGVSTKLVSCHAHNELERLSLVVECLDRGTSVALITDAGAPAVSDPGGKLTDAVISAGHLVEVFPGPSAVTAALMGAGLDLSRYVFLGFISRKGGKRDEALAQAAATGFGAVLFEAPARVPATLEDLHAAFGARRFVVARELTKLHETFHRGVLGDVMAPAWVSKGEAVVVVESGEPVASVASEDAVARVLADRARPPKARAKALSKLLGISTREAYEQVTAAASPMKDLLGHLAAAARLLASMGEASSAPSLSSEIDGADELMAFLAQRPLPVAAPVEAEETAKAILSALSAADALEEALEMLAETERQRADRAE